MHREAYRVFLADRGWVIDDLGLFTGRRAEDVFAVEPGPWSEHDPHELAAEVHDRIPHDATPEPVPGAHDLVHAAGAAGIPVAIVTSARPAWVALAVGEGLGVLDRIEVVVTARDVPEGKPHPAGFLLACERLGVEPATVSPPRTHPPASVPRSPPAWAGSSASPPPGRSRSSPGPAPMSCSPTSVAWSTCSAERPGTQAGCGRVSTPGTPVPRIEARAVSGTQTSATAPTTQAAIM